MKYFKYIFLIQAFLISLSTSLSAQEMRYERVDFNIKDIRIATNVWNDTILNIRVQFFSPETSTNSFEGVGTLSMCGCYCDSIWDAWPKEIDGNGIPGTATIGFSSSGGGNTIGSSGQDGVLPIGRNRGRRGTFIIDHVQGGILEDGNTFAVPITFKIQ